MGRKTTYFFHFYYKLSFGSLGSCVFAVVVDTSTFSLGSSFGGMVRVANTSSMLWEVSFSLEVSLGARGGSSEPWTTSILISPAFEVSSAYSTPFEVVPTTEGALGGLAVEPKELWGRMAGGGTICFLPSSTRKKPQSRLGWGLHPILSHNKSCT